jgi:hypothetical protein
VSAPKPTANEERSGAARLAQNHPFVVGLGVFATVIAIASGIVGLVTTLSNDPANGDRSITEIAFGKDIAAICTRWRLETEPGVRRDFRLLRSELRRARSSAAQSIRLVEYHQQVASRYQTLLIQFSALTPPPGERAGHTVTARAWAQAIDSYRAFRDALKGATTRESILKVARQADGQRSHIERDALRVKEGLVALSDGECELPRRAPLPVLTLPLARSHGDAAPRQTGPTASVVLPPIVDVAQPSFAYRMIDRRLVLGVIALLLAAFALALVAPRLLRRGD